MGLHFMIIARKIIMLKGYKIKINILKRVHVRSGKVYAYITTKILKYPHK